MENHPDILEGVIQHIDGIIKEKYNELTYAQIASTPMSPVEVQLLCEAISVQSIKLTRLCTLLMMQKTGLNFGMINALIDLRMDESRLRWFLDQYKRGDHGGTTAS